MQHAFTLLCYQALCVFILQNWNSVAIKQSLLSHPQPLANTTVLSVSMNLTPIGHISGIIQYLPACDWSISLSTMPSSFIHAVAGVRISIFFFFLKVYLFVFSYGGSSSLMWAFSSCGEQGLFSSCGVRASHCSGFSCCRAGAPGTWAPELWCTDLVALQHVGSSQTRDQTARQILNHCTTKEALHFHFFNVK